MSVAAAFLLTACGGKTAGEQAGDNGSIFVLGVLAPQRVSAGNTCVYSAQPTQAELSMGVLDLDFLSDYNPTYLLGNQLATGVNIATETVVINDAAGNQLATFTRETAATISPSSGGVPGYAPITLTTIDENTILNNTDVKSLVLSGEGGTVRFETLVTFNGQTLGGTNVSSGYVEFSVYICKGCLISFSSIDIRVGCAVPNCLNAGTSSISLLSPCVQGQDLAVDCSLCLSIPDCQGAPQSSSACSNGDGG
jgi:hypothetical protein